MGKLKNFAIVFDRPSRAYYPGQSVTGSVSGVLEDSMEMRGVWLKFVGSANVRWNTRQFDPNGMRLIPHGAVETYVDVITTLFGSAESSSRVTLAAGTFRFPFSVLLPTKLPSSFESVTGHVRYYAEATIDKPWKFDHVIRSPITVVGLVDLNRQPQQCKQPCIDSRDSDVSYCCWHGGSVSASLRVNRRCFVPRETIIIDAEIVNDSRSNINGTRADLKQMIVYRSIDGKTRHSTVHVASVVRSETIAPGTTDVWNNVPIVVPAVPPTKLGGCTIIDVNYALELCASAKYAVVKRSLEIIIGTIPLRQDNVDSRYAQQVATSPGIDLPPPPSYASCVNEPVSIVEDEDSR